MDPWEPNLLTVITAAAALAAALWLEQRRRYAFVIDIVNGSARVRRGKATPGFLHEVNRVCHEHSVLRGWVGGLRHGQRIRLVFSRSMPPPCQQKMRNVWHDIGWGTRSAR